MSSPAEPRELLLEIDSKVLSILLALSSSFQGRAVTQRSAWPAGVCSGVKAHTLRHSPTACAAVPPASLPPPPRLAFSHSFRHGRTTATHTGATLCPARTVPGCAGHYPPANSAASRRPSC